MTFKILPLLFIIILLTSCKGDSDIYATASGGYASKQGQFAANFPTEPVLSTQKNKIGADEFQVFAYRSTLGPNKIFSIEYYDYPGEMLTSMPNDTFLEQSISNYAYSVSANFELDYKEAVTNGSLEGMYFVLQPKEDAATKGINGMILGQVFKTKNRVYIISYMGVPDKRVTTFIDSFKIFSS